MNKDTIKLDGVKAIDLFIIGGDAWLLDPCGEGEDPGPPGVGVGWFGEGVAGAGGEVPEVTGEGDVAGELVGELAEGTGEPIGELADGTGEPVGEMADGTGEPLGVSDVGDGESDGVKDDGGGTGEPVGDLEVGEGE